MAGQTEKRLPPGDAEGGSRRWRDLGLLRLIVTALLSVSASAFLVVVELLEPAALFTATLLAITGFLQRYRARHRLRDRWYRPMRERVAAELAFSRLWIVTGIVLAPLVMFLPPFPAMAVSAASVLALLLKGLAVAARSAHIEKRLQLTKANAAEECWKVKRIAQVAESIPFLRTPEYISRLARYEVVPGQIGVLQFLALAVVGVAFFVYSGLALAVVVSEATRSPAIVVGPSLRGAASPQTAEPPPAGPGPTYAESCPSLENPRLIGHGLGRLFERDSAPKAGCGTHAIEVAATGAWVARGMCLDEVRSVAVSAPGQRAAILYGRAALFAWSEAQRGRLVGIETAEAGDGEVALVETLGGTYGFTRSSPSLVPGKEGLRWCWEATGVARPFVTLPPPLVLLWSELMDYRGNWSWPEGSFSSPGGGSFLDDATGGTTAEGACTATDSCHLEVDGRTWPLQGTAFVSMEELRSSMPPP